jgi:hypothetical protein
MKYLYFKPRHQCNEKIVLWQINYKLINRILHTNTENMRIPVRDTVYKFCAAVRSQVELRLRFKHWSLSKLAYFFTVI